MATSSKDEYPDLYKYDKDDNLILHPIAEALKDNTISHVEVITDFTDDHETCLCVKALVGGEEYKFTAMWLSLMGIRMFFHAECRGAKGDIAREDLKTFILETSADG